MPDVNECEDSVKCEAKTLNLFIYLLCLKTKVCILSEKYILLSVSPVVALEVEGELFFFFFPNTNQALKTL